MQLIKHDVRIPLKVRRTLKFISLVEYSAHEIRETCAKRPYTEYVRMERVGTGNTQKKGEKCTILLGIR